MLHIAGAGGFGRETLDVALALGVEVAGFLDDYRAGATVRGLPVFAPAAAPEGATYVVAIADPSSRRRLVAVLEGRGLTAATLVHPRATIAPETTVAPGCVVLAGAYVSSSVVLGSHVQVNYNATVGHDALLDAYTTVFPGGTISGAVHLGEGATVGANAVVLQGRTVGTGAFVGAGAVVTRDVAAGEVVAGVPARKLAGG
jgi:sugar O-acyltransferase (sialic acid O-acetyltransferase NeuD family)